MATNFYFRAVASDGKMRTGILHGETEKWVAQELRKQGLTPVYVGVEEKKSFELKLPFCPPQAAADVLFFTQELSTLLNAGVPLDRALSITSELTERPVVPRCRRRMCFASSKAASRSPTAWRPSPTTSPSCTSTWCAPAKRRGSLAAVFERLAEFERTRDDLRNYIISSMVYPALLATVGTISVIFLLTFVVPRFAQVFQDSHMKIPLPTKIMLEASNVVKTYGWMAVAGIVVFVRCDERLHSYATRAGLWWDGFRLKLPVLGIALRKAEVARFARAMSTLVANSVPLVQSIAIAGATLNNRSIAGSLADRFAGREAR